MSILLICANIFILYVNYDYISKQNYKFLIYNFDISKYTISDAIHFFLFSILFSYQYIVVYYHIKILIRKNKKNQIINSNLISIKYNNELDMCSICLDEYKPSDKISKIKKCTHIYHTKCIKEWLMTSSKLTCPLCICKLN